MRIAITCLLLMFIGFGILIFFNHPENKSGSDTFLAIPIVIEVLLLFIVFYAREVNTYRKVFIVLLIVWSLVFVLSVLAWIFLNGMRGAFLH